MTSDEFKQMVNDVDCLEWSLKDCEFRIKERKTLRLLFSADGSLMWYDLEMNSMFSSTEQAFEIMGPDLSIQFLYYLNEFDKSMLLLD